MANNMTLQILQQEGDDLVDSVNAKMRLANTVLMEKEYKDEANKPAEQARAATDATTKQEECAVAVSATSQPVKNQVESSPQIMPRGQAQGGTRISRRQVSSLQRNLWQLRPPASLKPNLWRKVPLSSLKHNLWLLRPQANLQHTVHGQVSVQPQMRPTPVSNNSSWPRGLMQTTSTCLR